MKKITAIFLITLCLLMVHSVTNAQIVKSLYFASQSVADQSVSERNTAIKSLFQSVLIKVSGQSDVTDNPDIAKQVKAALSYVTTFNFVREDGEQILVAQFNESSVDALLKSSGISIWGNQRPSAMLWLAHQGEDKQRLVVADDAINKTAQMVKQQSGRRGMPMLLPLWDLDDQFTVTASEVWGLFPDSVSAANARYATDFMILAKVSEYGLNQQLNWAIYKQDPNSLTYSNIVASGLDEFVDYQSAVVALVDQTSDFFARQYSVDTSGESGKAQFVVTNIDSIGKYVKVLNYLNSIKSLESVMLVHNSGQQFTFSAKLLGRQDSLSQVISLEKRLVSQFNPLLNATTYEWVR